MPIFSCEKLVRYDHGDYERAVANADAFGAFRNRFGASASSAAYEALDDHIFDVGIISSDRERAGIDIELTDHLTKTPNRPESVSGVLFLGEEDSEHEHFSRVLCTGEDLELHAHQHLLARLVPVAKRYVDPVGVGYLSLIGTTERTDFNLLKITETDASEIERIGSSTIADAGRLTVNKFVQFINGRSRRAQ